MNKIMTKITFPFMFSHTYDDGKKMIERWIAIDGNIRQTWNVSYSPYSKKWLVWFATDGVLVNNLQEAKKEVLKVISKEFK